jgi:hypothetical protein
MMPVWYGWDNGMPTPDDAAPTNAPVRQELRLADVGPAPPDRAAAGERPTCPRPRACWNSTRLELAHDTASGPRSGGDAGDPRRPGLRHRLVLREAPQPVIVSNRLRNVPAEAIYAWDPGAHLGIHRMDEFWFADDGGASRDLGYMLATADGRCWTLLVVSVLSSSSSTCRPATSCPTRSRSCAPRAGGSAVAGPSSCAGNIALDRPLWQQYLIWIGFWPGPQGFSGMLQGDFGWSFELDRPVADVVGEALWLTVVLNLHRPLRLCLGAAAGRHRRGQGGTAGSTISATFIGYIGLATPNFLLALILLYYGAQWFGLPVGGMMSARSSASR